jgi:hypothetical protein
LNLAKLMINIEKEYGSNNLRYLHGIAERNNSKFSDSEIKVSPKADYKKNVSVELLELFDNISFSQTETINVKNHLSHCVGIHRSYCEIYNDKESFFKLSRISLYKHGRKMGIKTEVQCKQSDIIKLNQQGYNLTTENNKVYWVEEITRLQDNVTRKDYADLAKLLNDKGIWYFIGNEGYTSYISSNPNCRYKPEIIIYNTMFYLGSITRYHPYMFDKIFSDKEQWMMSEFLTTQPKQFLYLATAKTLGQNVLKAYTSF